MFFDMVIYVQLFILSFILFIFMYKYMLIILMFMEMVIMNISLLMFLGFSGLNLSFYLIYFLVFSVCESVLGLSLLVIIVRFYGEDFYLSFNMSKF